MIARKAFSRAASQGAAQRITLLAAPGLGKSYLARRIVQELGPKVFVFYAQCMPFGASIPFWCIEQIVRQAETELSAMIPAGRDRAEALDRLYRGRTEERFWATRQLLQAFGRDKPLIIVFDDLQWASPTLLDLIDHIVSAGQEPSRLLILCLGRLELGKLRPEWMRAAEAVTLEPLPTSESAQLVSTLAPTGMPDSVIKAIIDAAAGNPLFIEQQVAAIIDDPSLAVCPDFETLLAARIERLPARERSILEFGSVHYGSFSLRSLAAMLPEGQRRGIRPHLQRLVSCRLLAPRTLATSADLQFTHLLVRNAVYEGADMQVRADAHERLARWICSHTDRYPQDWDAVAGYHLEQASCLRAALGGLDAATTGAGAAGLLEQAGRRAFARVNYRGDSAPELLARAVSLLPTRSSQYSELLPVYVAALSEGAMPDLAAKMIAKGLAEAGESSDRRLAARLQGEDAWLRFHVDSATKFSEALTLANKAVHDLRDLSADFALARAQYIQGTLLFCVGKCAAALEPLESCMTLARETRDRRMEVDAIWQLAGPIYWGPTPVDAAAARCRALRERTPYGSQPYAFMVVADAIFHAMAGHFGEARETARRGLAMYDELGIVPADVGLPQYSARLSLLLGDYEAATEGLRGACTAYARRGDTGYVSSTAGLLGEALYRQGRYDEALQAADLARSTAATDDFGAQMIWRSVRAKVLAQRGETAEAESLARQAVRIGLPTDCLIKRADALRALAEVLRLSRNGTAALRAARAAKQMYDDKGEIVSVLTMEKVISDLNRGVRRQSRAGRQHRSARDA